MLVTSSRFTEAELVLADAPSSEGAAIVCVLISCECVGECLGFQGRAPEVRGASKLSKLSRALRTYLGARFPISW